MLLHVTFSIFVYALVGKLVNQRQRVFETPLLGLGPSVVIRDADFHPVAASPGASPLHCPTHNSILTAPYGMFSKYT